ncbi:MAG: hypothetical protein WKF57_03895 [Nakamurella sp.]
MSAPARVLAGVPAGGQFAAGSHAESDVQLTPLPSERPSSERPPTEPARVLVTDVMGDEYLLTPGVIDDDADYVFRNGQCLALAVAVSRRTGWPIVLTCFDTPERFELGPDHPPDLVHATVRTPEGQLLDIRGPNDPDVREMDDRHDVEWPADRVDALMAAYDVDMERSCSTSPTRSSIRCWPCAIRSSAPQHHRPKQPRLPARWSWTPAVTRCG